ncbi:hypothetical protein BST81_12755 [Leptolyngbya sp. 'hensonii']|uniref:O-antigen ligase family protein n=1 Tax=Leptolyngbya sp. 'hensonii' TaxID=1922337 RepID=UPI00094F8CB6|nr:O-antigen ligase family protein [Leptolyngbya sp. 'hensonii']OLP17922.1 hypothetical protein BST81_12755 [Leptolyngbya sp. 'hensonii']
MAWLTIGFYVLFTLLPDSSTKVLGWPWVLLWQVGLVLPIVWLLGQMRQARQTRGLGNGLDWVVGLAAIVLLVSTLLAEFPGQARWSSWMGLCFLAALYAVNFPLQGAQQRLRLLVGQAYLVLALIVTSLLLWTVQTLLPELQRLQGLTQAGVKMPFDFYLPLTRNWAPIGHSSYVAGYLVLGLPLLIGLSLLQKGWQRWLWLAGTGLGLLDLYTTNSRGGWLGGVVAIGTGFVLLNLTGVLPRRSWLGLIGIGAVALLLAVTNSRLRSLLMALARGEVGGDFFRVVTATTGWQIGLAHPWFGAGPGSVLSLYQRYRPTWAGWEAEQTFQLHNTPIQLWAEVGGAGLLVLSAGLLLLVFLGGRWLRRLIHHPQQVVESDRLLVPAIYAALAGYGVLSLTDYQLDVFCISGSLIVALAFLAAALREQNPGSPDLQQPELGAKTLMSGTIAALGLLVAVVLWLLPIHRAWGLSNQGFLALGRQQVEGFVQSLSQAHQLAPWEPYYPLQLGWNLGNLSLLTPNPEQKQTLQKEGATWLEIGNRVAPYQEFGQTNLGWLLLNQNPQAATAAFARSARLIPAKRGIFYGLGLSLLAQGKVEPAITAIVLEALRDPQLITSSVWSSAHFQPLYGVLLDRLEVGYTDLLRTYPQARSLTELLHQSRGGVRWWRGNLAGARSDWRHDRTGVGRLVLDLAEGKSITTDLQRFLPATGMPVRRVTPSWALVLAAWLNPAQRSALLQQAWVLGTETPFTPELQTTFLSSMDRSATFDQWLKQHAPRRQYRRERFGFGPLNRHIDGPAPLDFLVAEENIPVSRFFESLLPAPMYNRELDTALQQWRDDFLSEIAP